MTLGSILLGRFPMIFCAIKVNKTALSICRHYHVECGLSSWNNNLLVSTLAKLEQYAMLSGDSDSRQATIKAGLGDQRRSRCSLPPIHACISIKNPNTVPGTVVTDSPRLSDFHYNYPINQNPLMHPAIIPGSNPHGLP